VTDVTQTVKDESDYYPFGGERVITNSDPNQYRFTGKERDAQSGLDYSISRHFGPNFGRFLQADAPLADQFEDDPGSWNLYSYVRNNPLSFTDPSGRHCVVDSDTSDARDEGDGGETCEEVEANNDDADPTVTVYADFAGTGEEVAVFSGPSITDKPLNDVSLDTYFGVRAAIRSLVSVLRSGLSGTARRCARARSKHNDQQPAGAASAWQGFTRAQHSQC
jgi:RHS repeat-associated protein